MISDIDNKKPRGKRSQDGGKSFEFRSALSLFLLRLAY